MEHESTGFLQVPITEDEHEQARSRSLSLERLLDDESLYSKEDDKITPGPTRFPSIRSPGTRYAEPETFQSFRARTNAQYAPISPIDEEDIVDAVPLQQNIVPPQDQVYRHLDPLPELWQPAWLRNSTLSVFALAFLALMGAVVALWVISRTRDGFGTSNPNSYQGWVYLPPVLVVIAVALWRPVDYYVKLLTPWDELQKGPVGPHKSLLLDYISPFQIVSLFKAFLHDHIPIGASVTTFILLKIATLFSVGLFVLLPTDITRHNQDFTATSKFDASPFDPNNLNSISSSPVYAYYTNLAQDTPFAEGVQANFVYSPFTSNKSNERKALENATISANVPAFFPKLRCHSVDAKTKTLHDTQRSGTDVFKAGNVTLALPNGDTCSKWSSVNVTIFDPQTNIVPDHLIQGYFQQVYCASGNQNDPDTSEGPAGLLYSILDVSYTQDLFGNASTLTGAGLTIASDSSWTISRISNVLCIPSYTIGTIKVTNDTTKAYSEDGALTFGIRTNKTNNSLSGFSAWNFTSVFAAAVDSAKDMFDADLIGADEAQQASKTLFTLMALSDNTQDLSTLVVPDNLSDAAETAFEGIMSQFVQQNFVKPGNTRISGTATLREVRYKVNEISAITLIAAFAVAAVSCFLLILLGPKRVVPRDPGSIAAAATTLTRSIDLNRVLRREGIPNLRNQKSALEGYEYGTAIATTESGQSSFRVVTSEGIPNPVERPIETKFRWWRPISSTIPFAAFAILLPVALIVVLEYLQRESDDNQGLLTVPDNQETELFTRYIPALVMLAVASLVNLIDFNISLFTPWARLRAGNSTYRESLLFKSFGRSPPFAFLAALRTKQINLMLSFIAAGLASTLAIIVTGLLDVHEITIPGRGFSVTQNDNFKLVWPNSFSDDNGAAGLLSSILHDNTQYPDFVYKDLVLPQFTVHGSTSLSNHSTLADASSIKMTGLRAGLKCDVLSSDSISVTTAAANETIYGANTAFVTVQAALPNNCQLGGSTGRSGTVDYQTAFTLPEDGSSIFAGRQMDLLFGTNASRYGNAGEFLGSLIADNPPVGCPSLAFTFGKFSLDNTEASQVTSMICYQQILQVQAQVTLLANTSTIDTSRPPIIDDNTSKALPNPNSTTGVRTFDWRIEENIAAQVAPFSTDDLSQQDLDLFFQAAIASASPSITPSDLIGSSNQNRLMATILNFYRQYLALAISLNMRVPLSSNNKTLVSRQTSQAPTIGTLPTRITTTRLVVYEPMKYTLQVLLGLITLFLGLAYLLTRFHHVLPCNPCSIAGTMSLLAGSDLCHSTDDGLCECCGKPRRNSFGTVAETIHADEDETSASHYGTSMDGERKQIISEGAEWLVTELWELVFAGKRYTMGWWRDKPETGRRRRFGVDVGGRADGLDDQDWELGKRASDNSRMRLLNVGQSRESGGASSGSRGRMIERGVGSMRGDRDGRGVYEVAGHGRMDSVEYSRSPDPGGNREEYQMSGGMGGEA